MSNTDGVGSTVTQWSTAQNNTILNFSADSLQTLETNFASLVDLQGGTAVNTFVRSFSNSTEQYVNGKFMLPPTLNASGNVTFNCWVSPVTGASSKNIGIHFNHFSVANGGAFDGSYTQVASGAIAITATTGNVTLASFTASLATLGWTANEMIEFKLSRDISVSNNLASNMYLFVFQIVIPGG